MKYRKKPVVIEAIQWTGTNLEEMRKFMNKNKPAWGSESYPDALYIYTLEGTHRADIGDWIIKGVQGEFYPCKSDIFEQTYEIANEKPKIICLCGSSRFVAEMAIIAWSFEKEGYIALGLHLLPIGYKTDVVDHLAEAEGVAAQMDALHLKKIDLADEIFIVNKNRYIGESTKREIEYATRLKKPIKYLESVG